MTKEHNQKTNKEPRHQQGYREIPELERVNQELRRQKEYYESLFINSPAAVVTEDLDGRVVSGDPVAEKLFGYTQQ